MDRSGTEAEPLRQEIGDNPSNYEYMTRTQLKCVKSEEYGWNMNKMYKESHDEIK
jgi:hypothetical protein